jgi:hypothetical protein
MLQYNQMPACGRAACSMCAQHAAPRALRRWGSIHPSALETAARRRSREAAPRCTLWGAATHSVFDGSSPAWQRRRHLAMRRSSTSASSHVQRLPSSAARSNSTCWLRFEPWRHTLPGSVGPYPARHRHFVSTASPPAQEGGGEASLRMTTEASMQQSARRGEWACPTGPG